MSRARVRLFAALLGVGAGCVGPMSGGRDGGAPQVHEADSGNRGPESYSAWFGDASEDVLYFGLSAFWQANWAAEDPRADLAQPGDQLIGRFDLRARRFLAPLRVRERGPDVRSSVWDVLVHSNGRLYFTTFFEPMGSVRADGGDPQLYPAAGSALNELVEGPEGRIWATRYGSAVGEEKGHGSVAVIAPDGTLERELPLFGPPGSVAAAKSLAVHPESGEAWVNTDTFLADGTIEHDTLHFGPDGTLLARHTGDPELLFPAFDRAGRAWLAERSGGHFRLRVHSGGADLATLDLGPAPEADFVQDIHFAPDGRAVLARWSGIVHVVTLDGPRLRAATLYLPTPPCELTSGPPLLYTAVVRDPEVFATVHCGMRIITAPLPELPLPDESLPDTRLPDARLPP